MWIGDILSGEKCAKKYFLTHYKIIALLPTFINNSDMKWVKSVKKNIVMVQENPKKSCFDSSLWQILCFTWFNSLWSPPHSGLSQSPLNISPSTDFDGLCIRRILYSIWYFEWGKGWKNEILSFFFFLVDGTFSVAIALPSQLYAFQGHMPDRLPHIYPLVIEK